MVGNSDLGNGEGRGLSSSSSSMTRRAGGGEDGDTGSASESRHQFLKWDGPGNTKLQEHLRTLYGDRGGEGLGDDLGIPPDMVLVSNDREGAVEAHKHVLSLCSPYFKQLFMKTSRFKSLNRKEGSCMMVLNEVKTPQQLKQFLQFIYTGEINGSVEEMKEFQEIGGFFGLEGITSWTRDFNDNQRGQEDDETMDSSEEGSEYLTTSNGGLSSVEVEPPNLSNQEALEPVNFSVADLVNRSIPVLTRQNGASTSKGGNDNDKRVEVQSTGSDCSSEDDTDCSSDEDDKEEDEENRDPTFNLESPKASTSTPCPRRSKRRKALRPDFMAWLRPPRPIPTSRRSYTKPSWIVHDPLSEETLRQSWRIRRHNQTAAGVQTTTYYCAAGGRSCPVYIQKRVLRDGQVVWLQNKATHCGHHSIPQPTLRCSKIQWTEQEAVSEELLKRKWHLRKRIQQKNWVNYLYLCKKGGRRCPVKLKKVSKNDGTVVWLSNQAQHANHPEPEVRRKSERALKRRRQTQAASNWTPQEPVSNNHLQKNWRVDKKSAISITYYCKKAGKEVCPARLKRKTLQDGTVLWLNNQRMHKHLKMGTRKVTKMTRNKWIVQEPVSEADLTVNWRVNRYTPTEEGVVGLYHCAAGRDRCPARLKKLVMQDGSVVWMNNQVGHTEHPSPQTVTPKRGLTPEQKTVVLECLERGMRGVEEITQAFEEQGKQLPEGRKLTNYLDYLKRRDSSGENGS